MQVFAHFERIEKKDIQPYEGKGEQRAEKEIGDHVPRKENTVQQKGRAQGDEPPFIRALVLKKVAFSPPYDQPPYKGGEHKRAEHAQHDVKISLREKVGIIRRLRGMLPAHAEHDEHDGNEQRTRIPREQAHEHDEQRRQDKQRDLQTEKGGKERERGVHRGINISVQKAERFVHGGHFRDGGKFVFEHKRSPLFLPKNDVRQKELLYYTPHAPVCQTNVQPFNDGFSFAFSAYACAHSGKSLPCPFPYGENP